MANPGNSALEDRILALLRAQLPQQLPPDGAGANLDAQEIADAMLAAIPTRHPYEDLGPFYDGAGLRRWRGITRQALDQQVKRHRLLAPLTGEGERVYPAWQFTPDGRLIPGLTKILPVLLGATDPWTAATWLMTPSKRLSGSSAVDTLRAAAIDARPVQAVLALAHEDAERWSR